MSGEQVSNLLNYLNSAVPDGTTVYRMDEWLRCSEISAIILGTDENIYPDDTCQVMFSGNGINMLMVRLGKYNENGIFEPTVNPYFMVPFDEIVGVEMLNHVHSKSPFKRGSML